jgi:hypothetical protein
MSSGLKEQFSLLFVRLRDAGDRLAADLDHCWRDSAAITAEQRKYLATSPAAAPVGLRGYRDSREELARLGLREVAVQLERRRPLQRALEAMHSYDRALEEMVTVLPETLWFSGSELISALAPVANMGISRIVAWRRKPRPVRLRAMAAQELVRASRERTAIESRLMAVLVDQERTLVEQWSTATGRFDAAAGAISWDERSAKADLSAARAEQELEALRRFAERSEHQVAEGLRRSAVWLAPRKAVRPAIRRSAHLDGWAARVRAADTAFRLEQAVHDLTQRLLSLAEAGLASLEVEREGLIQELDRVRDWIVELQDWGGAQAAPDPVVDLVPASSRQAELDSLFAAELSQVPKRPQVLGADGRIRKVEPRKTIEAAWKRHARAAHDELFAEVEGEHRLLLQEIERARQVVAFGMEAAAGARNASEAATADQLRSDALSNALALVAYYRDRPAAWQESAEGTLVRGYAETFFGSRVVLTRDRLGALGYLTHQGVRQAWPVLTAGAVETFRTWLGKAWDGAQWLVEKFLEGIGWRADSRERVSEVVARPILPPEFTAHGPSAALPAIYRHLFRTDPVSDPRFLVGRETELTAIAEARLFWQSGRGGAVLLVGERGSGKTSLINCAQRQSLSGVEVVRAEFPERVTTEFGMRAFLAKLIDSTDPDQLEQELASRRRVIILEELERTFLRTVGGFAAIRALQRMVAATCTSTMWILSLNAMGFRLLDAALSFSSVFSHRINAGTASTQDLRFAVLQRHRLSGLRLQFAAPRAPESRYRALVEKLDGGPDPEEAFFEQLSAESGGVYRTAFDLWLGHIDSVDAGAVRMKALTPPEIAPVVQDLDQQTLFTLASVLQHGSLLPEEMSAVFGIAAYECRARIDNLCAREILEPEPQRPGYRVRPQAARLVREALYRRNLL